MTHQIALSSPDISEAEIEAVTAVLRTPYLSLGAKLDEFERTFTDRLGVKHAIATSSGTAALHLLWRAFGLEPGDEVITTPFSFIASANSILFDGGKPVFVDIDPATWQIDVNHIEAAITSKTKALLPVDVFGSFPDLDAVWSIAKKHGLRVLEDSCEALGAIYKGRPAGTIGEAGTFGFYPNKQITTGEGGMIVTNDDRLAFLTRSLRNQGRDPDAGWLQHARLGYNYRISDINCALGTVQMRRLDEILAKRARVAGWYQQRVAEEPRLTMMEAPDDVRIAWFVMVVRLNDDYSQQDRDRILSGLRTVGVACSNYFTPIHLQPFYQEQHGYKQGDFPITEALSARTVALPFHNHLSEADVDTVVTELRKLL
ncbi:MAG: DegT/DnrJ/EryC1/StrS family aminotransferase [Planctomycetes bacterium]|nr:DegT/DnrJ/EryC1/StrS family aminotransferase [Planctomycetota bacterium]